jgi:ribosomal-protein-alanine N-acetyltransferase
LSWDGGLIRKNVDASMMNAILQDPGLRMRPMRDDDLASVHAVELAAYPHPWTEGIFRDCLRVGYCCWVTSIGETVVGHGVMSVAAGECHLLNLCVHPKWQRCGVGRKLLRRLLGIARRRNADTAFLEVRVTNHSAIRLYQSEGFCEVGVRRGYYPCSKGREDALVFALAL